MVKRLEVVQHGTMGCPKSYGFGPSWDLCKCGEWVKSGEWTDHVAPLPMTDGYPDWRGEPVRGEPLLLPDGVFAWYSRGFLPGG